MSAVAIRDAYDVAVVGAGPAGLAAATVCAKAGLSTVLLDEQASAGGQIYRAITETPVREKPVLGESYWRGAALVEAFRSSGAEHVAGATVWSLTREREIGVSVGGGAQLTGARRVILCTGALERPFPIPGWTLPGVMTAGAAQILLKSAGLVASGRTVLAGCGPLLWLLAWQYLNAGANIDAILDTTAEENRTRALPHVPRFLLSGYFLEGLKLVRAVKREVRVISGVTALRAIGDTGVRSVAFRRHGDVEETRLADTLLLHQGVAPNVNLALSAGVEHRWDESQLCWAPVLDDEGNSSVEGIAVAGDGAGIAGAQAAEWRGRLAAIAAARALGFSVPAVEEARARRELKRCLRGRAFLDTLYRPAKSFRQPSGDTIVCRCEEVTARQITDTVALGCPGPNQMKAFLRCGMGLCQGRLCGLTVTELIAEGRGVPPQQVGYYRLRPPVKPITVAELAALPKTEAAVKAVVRI
ncbi:MAG: FAD-dependent oxidoreductase [Betaproteobacteria bacterium]|nr:FAD-dependent oxidoreductase [Betaproteobacteria bacterium]